MKRKLCVSFQEDEQIQEISRDNTFKINTRNLLGIKNKNDWIYSLNIGNVMHLTPFTFYELHEGINQAEDYEKLNKELETDQILERIIFLAGAYFCIATELRFLNKKVDSVKFPKKLSETWHAKAVHT